MLPREGLIVSRRMAAPVALPPGLSRVGRVVQTSAAATARRTPVAGAPRGRYAAPGGYHRLTAREMPSTGGQSTFTAIVGMIPSPAGGRHWIRLGKGGGINLYGFVDNNSISYCDLLGLDTYILIYQSFGPMPFWKDSVKRSILARGSSIVYLTPFSCYDEGDKIVEIPVSSASDLEKINNERDVVYVGIFGHGRWNVIFFKSISGPDVAIADTSSYVPESKPHMISTEAFTSRIHWKPCSSCCDDGLAIDLYACNTTAKDPAGKLPSIGEQIKTQVNGIQEGWGSIPGGDSIFVGGIAEGMSNFIPDKWGMLPGCFVIPSPESRMPGVAPRNHYNKTCPNLNAFP